jgi:drug/metabolite transporter (DMT)-like permease
MTTLQILGLCFFGLLLALGQVLFKLAGRDSSLVRGWLDIAGVFATPWFWLALVVYGGATLLWIVLLQRVPLSRAYPFAALGFVLVPAASVWIFGERITLLYVIGSALVVLGILTIGASE